MAVTPVAGKLPVRTKLAYGLGTVAFGIKDQGFNTFLMLYYNQIIGLPAAWVGTAIMIAMIVDAVADPLIGHFSDHFRSRWGRRHPFMYASAIPLAVGYFLLWSPPQGSHGFQFAYLLLTSIAVRVAISFYEIPSSALMAEFTSDYDERTSISTYRAMFYAVGSVGMSILALKVFLHPTADQPLGQLNAAGYTTYGAVAAVLMFLTVLTSARGTHNRISTLHFNQDAGRFDLKGLLGGLKAIVFDRTYASVLLCTLFFGVAGGFAVTLGVYVATYFWRLTSADLSVIAGATVLGVILALLVVHLSKKLGKKPTALVLYTVALLAATIPVVLGLMKEMPTGHSALLTILVLKDVLLIMCILAAIILSSSMVADVADYFQLKSGQQMEGLMFSALVMVSKMVSGMGIFLSGIVLSSINFPDKASSESVDPGIVTQLVWAYVVGMGGLCALAIIALSFYPITRASHERILRELQAH